jgi:hypothetical protein
MAKKKKTRDEIHSIAVSMFRRYLRACWDSGNELNNCEIPLEGDWSGPITIMPRVGLKISISEGIIDINGEVLRFEDFEDIYNRTYLKMRDKPFMEMNSLGQAVHPLMKYISWINSYVDISET